MSSSETGMALTGHLKELRKRLVISVIAVAIGFSVSYYYSENLYRILAKPLLNALSPGQEYLVFTGLVEPFFIYMKVGFAGGMILASPVILYEIWAFVAPGLYSHEKLWFISLVISSLFLFICGALFAYLVVFPFGFKYLLSYSSQEIKPLLSMSEYFSMVTKLLLAFGVVFQLPLGILVLARLGVVTAKQLLSWWRYAIVIILLVAAILTPTPDIFNQLLMAGPLMVLYAVGIIVAKLFGRQKAVKEAEPEAEKDENEG